MLKLKGCTIEHTDDMLAIAEITNATHEATLYPKYRPSLLLDMLVPIAGSQDMQANLEELFPVWIERHGVQRARWIQRAQVAQLIGGNWWENILSSAERLLKIVKLIGF
jgi:hypothetical protein